MAKPTFEEIVKLKDELLNNLFEGLGFGDTNTLGLTPAQHYRKTALQTFLEQDLHHRDLVSIFNEVFEIPAVGNVDMIINKLVDFYVAEDKLSKRTKTNIYPVPTKIKEMGGNRKKLTKYFNQIRVGGPRLLEAQWNQLIDLINQEDLYMGIRHVMPESIEMRILINDMDDYLGLLENLDRPSFDVTPYTRLDWDRVRLRGPKNARQILNIPYRPPNNLQQLKEMHQRFKDQFAKKAQEYILGENILLTDDAEFKLLNEEYYQYLGWGQASGDQPIMQINEKMQELYEKLYGQEKGQYFYEKAVEYGFEDANEWFDEVLKETNATDPMTVLWDKTSREAENIARDRVKAKVDKFMVRSPFDDRFPDEMEFKLGPVTKDTAAGASIYQVTDNPLADIPDTPTNVVDDVPTLNSDLVWREDLGEEVLFPGSNTDQPRWKKGVVEKNNILKPNLRSDDLKKIIPQILDGTVSDIDFTRFGIWLMHKSPTPAFGSKPFNSSDALADVTKIVIFNGKSPIDLVNEEVLERLKDEITFDIGAFTTDKTTGPNAGSKSMVGLSDELILQFGREEGPFANAQQRMKQTIINEHNKLYANSEDYFILFRGGELTNDPVQSFSKDGFQAHSVGFQTNQETIRKGRGIDGYFVNKNDFIDLHSLGLDAKGEMEVIAYKEGVNKPIQKTVIDESVRDFNYLDKDRLKFIENNWSIISSELPKKGFIVSDTPPNTTLRVMEETGLSSHSDRIRKVAQDYHKIMGYSDPEFKPAMVFNDEIGAAAADIFEQLPMFDDNAIPYYKKFIQETNMQYQVLLDSGMQFEVVDGDPYTPNRAGHQEMIADMENGRLKVLATEAGFGDEATSKLNPMLAESKYTDVNGRVMLENDVFRAVHDTFGHGMRGNTFGPIGEYNAWLAHKEMYSADARRVMTTETLGQNTFTNYGPHMRDANGNLLSKADAGYIKPADRPFASQKVALMPEEIINVAGTVVEDAADLVDTSSLNKVVELANTQPQVVDGIMNSAKKVVGKAFNTAAGVLDPGDLAITAGITRLLPRLGVAAIAPAALAAYVGYELSVLAIDAAQAFDKARQKQGIELLDYDNTNPDINWKQLGKDTWNEFGEISDTWSLSWKISEPIIDYAFGEYAKLQENR